MTSDPDRMASLLAVARDLLRRELQPALEPGQRYNAAMIANAMAIASRALASGEDVTARQHAALSAFLDAPGSPTLGQLRRRVARDLRLGRIAPEHERALRTVLRACVLARLEITAPDYPATFEAGDQAR